MKRYILTMIVAVLVVQVALAADSKEQGAGTSANDGNKTAERIKALNAQARARFRSNFQGKFASYFTKGIDDAAAAYREILAMPDAPPAAKLAASKELANCLLEKMDVDGANAVLADALKLPGLTADQKKAAIRNQANVFYRQLAYDKALPMYEAFWAESNGGQRKQLENDILKMVASMKGADAAIALMKTKYPDELRLAGAYLENGQRDEALAIYDGILTEEAKAKTPNRGRQRDALVGVVRAFANSPFVEFKAEFDKRMAVAPSLRSDMLNALGGHPLRNLPVARKAAFKEWLADSREAMAKASGRPMKPNARKLDALIRRRDAKAALVEARRLLADKDVPADLRRQVELNVAVLEAGDDAAAAVKKVTAAVDADAATKKDASKRAKTLLSCANTAMRLRNYTAAKALLAARNKMVVAVKRPSLRCPFVADAPQTVSEFRESAHWKDAKNRAQLTKKYGNNLKFLLETDANLTGRTVTYDGSGKPTEFTALCDAGGVSLYFFAPTDKARAVEAGFANLGGYEMYLAAGPNEPYDCFLVGFGRGGGSTFSTQYDNMDFRKLTPGKNMTVTNRFYDDGIATLIRLDWTAFFNRLPENDSVWDFEVCHWDKGGRSWGGSKSVHNRSSFGALVFENLTPENQRAIKRRLIPAAAGMYRRALSSQNGYLEIWQDPELGDHEFFFDVIEPLQARLGKYLPKVKYAMTDTEVDDVFENAAKEWMNINYIVSDLRRDYLDKRRVGDK